MKNDITLIKKSIPNTLLSEVEKIEVSDTKSLSTATDKLSQLNSYLDKVAAWREAKSKPLNSVLKVIRAETKSLETMLESAITIIRAELSRYATVIANDKLKAEAKIEKRLESGSLGIEKAVEKLGALESVPEKIEVASGSLQFRHKQILKITNIDRIPRVFMVVDEGKLLEALKRGDEIEGAELSVVQVPYNTR